MINLIPMEEIQTGKSNRLKLAAGDSKRISFVLFQGYDAGTPDFTKLPLFVRASRIYVQGMGNVIDEGPASKITGIKSKEYYATIIAVWPTTPGTMKPLTSSIIDDDNYELKFWVMTKSRMEEIKKAHGMTGANLSTADIGVNCVDEQYQKMQIQSLGEGLFYKFCTNPKTTEFAAKLHSEIQAMVPSLENQIGSRMSAEDIRQKWSMVNQEGAENTGNAAGNAPGNVIVPPGVISSDADDILGNL
jgi:hypothetical protein